MSTVSSDNIEASQYFCPILVEVQRFIPNRKPIQEPLKGSDQMST